MVLLYFVLWPVVLPTIAIVATSVLRRRVGADDGADKAGGGDDEGSPQAPPSSSGSGSATLLAAAAALLLTLVVGLGILMKGRWGAWRASCKPPGPLERLTAWGSNLAGFEHTISTKSREAQIHFNQGLLLAFDFNRAESLISFQACQQADPTAAMCAWGEAYAQAPFLNVVDGDEGELFPVFGPRQFQGAREAAFRALQLAQAAAQRKAAPPLAQRELAYCKAAAERFAPGSHRREARARAERAYAQSMQTTGQAHKDATALALAAEGLLNLVPWDFLDPAIGVLRQEAVLAERLLLNALRIRPTHELALHLHVHLAEVAPTTTSARGPSEGELSADRLRGLQPRMAHLLHMPSHVYIRVGRYPDAVLVNKQAYQADLDAAKGCLQSYLPEHNLHMLLFAASMAGQYAVVEEYASKLWELPDAMPLSAWPGRERTLLLLAQVRFAQWDRVLKTARPAGDERGPADPGGQAYATVIWHYARCLALAASVEEHDRAQRVAAARDSRWDTEREVKALRAAVTEMPPDLQTRPGQGYGIYSNSNNALAAMAVRVVEARLHSLDGEWEEAAAALAAAAEAEQKLGYVEPPRLLQQPLLQCLGWVRLHLGQYEAAAEAYRRDLANHPGNGWSLLGLAQALMQSGLSEEAAQVRQRFQAAWAHADWPLASSCPAFAG